MTIQNADNITMEEVEVFGTPALFTAHKAFLSGTCLCRYEVKALAHPAEHPYVLTHSAEEGFFGTVFTPIPVDIPEEGERPFLPGDFYMRRYPKHYTPEEFDQRYMTPRGSKS